MYLCVNDTVYKELITSFKGRCLQRSKIIIDVCPSEQFKHFNYLEDDEI
jgi:hypothetical protein